MLSVVDLEPSGVIVTAYNQIDSKEYSLPISERELSICGYTRGADSLTSLLESMELVERSAGFWSLQSTNEGISKNKRTPTSEEIDQIMSSISISSSNGAGESINDVLVRGLVELCKVKPVGLDAVEWLGQWLVNNNPSRPSVADPDDA